MTKLIIATLLGWVVTVIVASALVTGTLNPAPTISTIPYAYVGQCMAQTYMSDAYDWQATHQTSAGYPSQAVRHDQGKDSIKVPMLTGDMITPYEGGE